MNEIQFLIYDHGEHTEVLVQDETLWATQKSIAQLFGVSVPTINEHLKNIFESGELAQHSTIRKIRIVRQEGNRQVTREIEHYNLDAIISVGYRVNSQKATKFRIWASEILKAYIQKGFAIDIERLRQGENAFGKDYFRELLETVRSIRASEQRIWKQLTDIFAEISYDYDKNSEITRQFYANVQNKFHYAITGQTAAEIVYSHADQSKKHMGLSTWKNAPDGRILQSDVVVAK
ncbi:virulence RhuM family protein, partial [Pasteurellaceae bacterium Phil11]